jgi:hypothetical protein
MPIGEKRINNHSPWLKLWRIQKKSRNEQL